MRRWSEEPSNGITFGLNPYGFDYGYPIGATGWKETRCAIVKRRCDAPNVGFYGASPIDRSGFDWIVWHMTNRFNPSVSGAIRMVSARLASLYASIRYYLPFNDAARGIGWLNSLLYSVQSSRGDGGESATYTVVVGADGLIYWEWQGTQVSGDAYFVIKDSLGVEIAAGYYAIPTNGGGNRYVDTYKTGVGYNFANEIYGTVLAHNLPADTYSVIVSVPGSSGSGGGIRVYDVACYSCDVNTAGDIDSTDPLIVSAAAPAHAIGVGGNIEYAAHLMKSGGAYPADVEYCCGTHGYESAHSGLSILVDDGDVAATLINAATLQGKRWISKTAAVSFQTTVITRVGATNWATLDWTMVFGARTYECSITRTTLIDVEIDEEYWAMNECPNLPNGGTNHLVASGVDYTIGTITPLVQANYTPPAGNVGSRTYNTIDGWEASVEVLNRSAFEGIYPHANQSAILALVTDRVDGIIKDYRATVLAFTNTVPVLAGDAITIRSRWRVDA